MFKTMGRARAMALALCCGALVLAASGATYAGFIDGVLAKQTDDESVELKLTSDADGTATITIGANEITFRVHANRELDTGRLEIAGDTVVIELFDTTHVKTDDCTIPVDALTSDYTRFCFDNRGPSLTISPSRQPNSNGWYRDSVTLTFRAEDEQGGSGIDAIIYRYDVPGNDPVQIPNTELELEENGRIGSYDLPLRYADVYPIVAWAVDRTGNASERESLTVRIDTRAPSIEGRRLTPANQNGWNNGPVQVVFECEDGSGAGASGIDRCTGQDSISGEGANRSIQGEAVDKAGNRATDTVGGINIDRSSPRIQLDVTLVGGGAGFTWEIGDSLAGIDRCELTLIHASGERMISTDCMGESLASADVDGAGSFTLRAWAIDRAGNEETTVKSFELEHMSCSITGQVVDATNDEPVPGASVVVREMERYTTTDWQGRFAFADLPPNTYTVAAGKEGEYNTGSRTVDCVASESSPVKLALSPIGDWRIVLSWNLNPSDLDSHLWAPDEHVWYANALGQRVQLDHDVMSGSGPETITMLQWVNGVYTYAVKHFDGSGTLGSSGAQVELYNPVSNTPIRTYTSPACSTGAGTWWIVFRLHVAGGEVVEIEPMNRCLETFDEGSMSPPLP